MCSCDNSRVAERVRTLPGEGALEVFARASTLQAQGRDIVHLEIGEPDFDTPPHIRLAAAEALDAGLTHYSPAAGIPQLREEIAAVVTRTRGIPVAPGQVIITAGSKVVIFFTMLTLLEPGDEVIYPNPGFPVYEAMIGFAGAKPVPVPLLEGRDFAFDLEAFRASVTPRTKLVVLNSPQNPTGGVLDRHLLDGIADVLRPTRAYILSDEIYSQLQYEGDFVSIASLPGMEARTIILDGFSKSYAMTGWRLGYGVFPEELVEPVTRLVINSYGCPSSFVQWAGIEALRGPHDAVEAMAASFRRRRDLMVEGLNAIPGVRCARPKGAFYVFPNVCSFGLNSHEIANYLLEKADVGCLPGSAFGSYGEGYLRLTYANSEANIQRALDRIAKALAHVSREPKEQMTPG